MSKICRQSNRQHSIYFWGRFGNTVQPRPDYTMRRTQAECELTGIDPFDHLPTEIASLIIEALDPPDTRRVWKSWKVL